MVTRIIDIIIALIGLTLLLLGLPVIAFFIKVDSRGPVFYKCDRVGLNGKVFKMYKFRTMYENPANLGPSLSPLGDPRVTPVGKVLRRLKLNEIPQFFNVLKGDMSLIGPRPESLDLAQAYPEFAQKIFTVKPGLMGPNQILGRNEEEIYPPGVDPVKFYLEQCLPRKVAVDLDYIDNKSVLRDLKYLLLGVKVTVTEAISRRHLADNLSQLFMLGCDACLCVLSFSLALYIRFGNADHPLAYIGPFVKILPLTVLARMPIFIYLGFYHTLIRHLSFYDIKRVIKGVALSSLFLVVVTFLAGFMKGYSRAVFIIDWLCLTSLLIGYRTLLMTVHHYYVGQTNSPGKRKNVVILGAGDAGELCLRYLQKEQEPAYNIVGFIDDNPQKRGKRIGGVRILGDRHHLGLVAKIYNVREVFIAIPSATESEIKKILDLCVNLGLASTIFLSKITAQGQPADTPRQVSPVNGYPPWAEAQSQKN
jgi:lipopolysaccharide/colanic/teichoic acid biosynthesis glycosyltransferase